MLQSHAQLSSINRMLSSIKKHTYLQVFCLFCSSLIIFTWGIKSQEVIGFDSRFYLFALEMWDYGLSFFPTTYHQPYPDYSSASTLLIYLVATVVGHLNKFTAILPSAILAAATVIFTYLIAQFYSKRWGLYAVFFLFMTVTFLSDARSITLDMYTTLFTTICFYLLLLSDFRNKPKIGLWIYPFLVLGFIFRGPIGLIIPTSVVISYYLLDGKYKQLLVTGVYAFLLLMICSLLLCAVAYIEGGSQFTKDVLRMQCFGRINDHFFPAYFYFVHSLSHYALSFPIILIVIIQLAYSYFTSNGCASPASGQHELHQGFERTLLKLLAWIAVIIIGMSIPGDKKTRYILPIVPGIALIASYVFVASPAEKILFYCRNILCKFFFCLPIIFIIVTICAYAYENHNHLNLQIHYLFILLSLIAIECANLLFYSQEEIIVFGAALSFVITFISLIEPITLHIERAHDFVTKVEYQRLQHKNALIFYSEHADGLPIKYIINMPYREYPQFIQSPQGLLNFSPSAYFVTSEHSFRELPNDIKTKFEIVAKDKVGHVEVVVFQKG